MSLRQGIIVWVSGSLTTLIMMSVFLTIFRNELDAARTTMHKARAMLEKTESVLRILHERSEQIQRIGEGLQTTANEIVATNREIHTDVFPRIEKSMNTGNRTLDVLDARISQQEAGMCKPSMLSELKDGIEQLTQHVVEGCSSGS